MGVGNAASSVASTFPPSATRRLRRARAHVPRACVRVGLTDCRTRGTECMSVGRWVGLNEGRMCSPLSSPPPFRGDRPRPESPLRCEGSGQQDIDRLSLQLLYPAREARGREREQAPFRGHCRRRRRQRHCCRPLGERERDRARRESGKGVFLNEKRARRREKGGRKGGRVRPQGCLGG